jgi:hypothetical protein
MSDDVNPDSTKPQEVVKGVESKQSPEQPPLNPVKDSLPAWMINTDGIKNQAEQQAAEAQIKLWVGKIQKDVSEVLEKNGVKTFQLTILHQGSGTPIPLGRGTNCNCGRLAVYACRMFKARIDQEFAINLDNNS